MNCTLAKPPATMYITTHEFYFAPLRTSRLLKIKVVGDIPSVGENPCRASNTLMFGSIQEAVFSSNGMTFTVILCQYA